MKFGRIHPGWIMDNGWPSGVQRGVGVGNANAM